MGDSTKRKENQSFSNSGRKRKTSIPWAETSETQECVYAVVPQTDFADQYDIQGTFRLSHFLIRVLFKFGCIVFMFIAAFGVNALGLKVETFGKVVVCEIPPRD